MDGIFGGRNMAVNIRDFQWKTFTPMQLNMDGWGLNEKYPHALGKTATTINRRYLKLKSMLLPYTYTFAHEAIDGKPLIQAMFLSSPNPFTLGRRTQYQFLYGPSFLVAPIYQETKADADGNDIRNGIYLPEGIWHDYFTGEAYMGNCVMNTFAAPIWKLPVFVRQGAIIPMNNPNNNPSQIDPSLRILEIFPSQQRTSISVYDDDGTTDAYLAGASTTYQVEQQLRKGKVVVTINPATGKDQYNTDPVPEGKPAPVEPQDATITDVAHTCTISIRCDTILDHLDWLDPEKVELVPDDGVILAPVSVTFYEGESVFNVLQRVCKQNAIHMEFENTPMYNSAYIEGIHNLYEFDCGELSGWMYSVNGWFPNYGCSRYALQAGDVIAWVYTCDLGYDVGGGYAVGN